MVQHIIYKWQTKSGFIANRRIYYNICYGNLLNIFTVLGNCQLKNTTYRQCFNVENLIYRLIRII